MNCAMKLRMGIKTIVAAVVVASALVVPGGAAHAATTCRPLDVRCRVNEQVNAKITALSTVLQQVTVDPTYVLDPQTKVHMQNVQQRNVQAGYIAQEAQQNIAAGKSDAAQKAKLEDLMITQETEVTKMQELAERQQRAIGDMIDMVAQKQADVHRAVNNMQ